MATGALTAACDSHAATLRPNCNVLVAGGEGNYPYDLSSVELSDISLGGVTKISSAEFQFTALQATNSPSSMRTYCEAVTLEGSLRFRGREHLPVPGTYHFRDISA